jgi:hypothetical protein
MKNMLNWQPQGSEAWTNVQNTNQRQQQLDLEKQQDQRQQQAAEVLLHQNLTNLGAMPGDAQTGLIKVPMTNPDGSPVTGPDGQPARLADTGGPPMIVRKMDPERTVKFKDSTGNQVAYELPTPEEQTHTHLMNAMLAQNAPDVVGANRTAALNTASQTAAGENLIREMTGAKLSDVFPQDMLDKLGLKGDAVLDRKTVQDSVGKVIAPAIRADSAEKVEDGRDARAKYVADLKAQTEQSIAALKDDEFSQHQDNLNKWNQANDVTKRWLSNQTTGRQKMSSDAVDARAFLNNFERSTAQHTSLSKSASGEEQKQIAATGILGNDPTGQPNTRDGDSFIDPFDGKTKPMNYGNRVVLQSRLGASQKSSSDMRGKISQLESVRDGLLSRIGGSQVPGQQGQGGAATPAGGTPRTNQQPKTATRMQVQAYAKQKGIPEAQATQEFTQGGYTVTK